ncbi:MAG: hypothetical protein KGL39_44580 [Patescibacteria group bacterium]|nr:hypothetical protein [Patescibacteria group bacterium]
MRILVVEDDVALRELLAHILRNQREGVEVLEAGNLDDAGKLLPRADAVLCDGSFPTHPGTRPEFVSVCDSNWARVRLECERLKIPFVMLSGNKTLVNRLNDVGTLAFAKPDQVLDSVRSVVVLGASIESVHQAEDLRKIEEAETAELPVAVEQQRPQPEPRAWWRDIYRR